MKERKKLTKRQKATLLLAITALFVLGVGIYVFSSLNTKVVRPGITLDDAKKIVDENAEYYIIRADYSTGIDWFIGYGDDEGIEVWLEGEMPGKYLSSVFFFSKSNSFLVKGTEFNKEYKGGSIMEAMGHGEPIYTVKVESWEIITPIGRDYTYEHHERFLYPTDYLDQYDVDRNDYNPDGWF